MSRLARRLNVAVPVGIVAAALVVAYVSYEPDSGVDVQVLGRECPRCPIGPLPASVEVRHEDDVEANGRTGDNGRLRLRVEPGRYVVRAALPGTPRAREAVVEIREEAFAPVVLRIRI